MIKGKLIDTNSRGLAKNHFVANHSWVHIDLKSNSRARTFLSFKRVGLHFERALGFVCQLFNSRVRKIGWWYCQSSSANKMTALSKAIKKKFGVAHELKRVCDVKLLELPNWWPEGLAPISDREMTIRNEIGLITVGQKEHQNTASVVTKTSTRMMSQQAHLSNSRSHGTGH